MTENRWCNVALPLVGRLKSLSRLNRGGRAVLAIYLDFREAFSIDSHSVPTVKWVKYRVEKCARWMDDQLGCAVKWVLISSANSTLKGGWLLMVFLGDSYRGQNS